MNGLLMELYSEGTILPALMSVTGEEVSCVRFHWLAPLLAVTTSMMELSGRSLIVWVSSEIRGPITGPSPGPPARVRALMVSQYTKYPGTGAPELTSEGKPL